MQATLKQLTEQLNLEKVRDLCYRGHSQDLGYPRVFGGQVLGQALSAAQQTVDSRDVHSLHAYFLRPGDPKKPLFYEVDCIRDGKSFTTRRIVAKQDETPIFNMSCSFQKKERGFSHQGEKPRVPEPETLKSISELANASWDHIPERFRFPLKLKAPIEIRPVHPINYLAPKGRPPQYQMWLKAASPLPQSRLIHQSLLAYASDFSLLETALLPHGVTFIDPSMQVASLDHAMWFHGDFRIDDWLLYSIESPAASNARGFSRGHFFDRKGTLVASTAQEGLIRKHEP